MIEKAPGRGFGADMPGHAVIEGPGLEAMENAGRRAVDEPVQNHGCPLQPAGKNGARHGGNLPSAQ